MIIKNKESFFGHTILIDGFEFDPNHPGDPMYTTYFYNDPYTGEGFEMPAAEIVEEWTAEGKVVLIGEISNFDSNKIFFYN